MRYDHTQIRMTSLKKSMKGKGWTGCGKKGTLMFHWWEYKLVQTLWRPVCRFLKNTKRELPSDPAIPLLGMYPEKTVIQKDKLPALFLRANSTMCRCR